MWGIIYGSGGPEQEPLSPGEVARTMFPALVGQGPHAYGWMSWRGGDHPIDVRKYPGRCDSESAARRIQMPRNSEWVIGHTRLATHGSPDDNRNNHPIPHGNVVGIHNGVLRGYGRILDVTGREDPGTEVDSEAIFAAVNKWGAVDGLRRVQGNMVTIFVDRDEPHIVNIARSYGRPLVMAWTKAGSLVFASEAQALDKLQDAGMWLSDYTTLLGDYRMLRVVEGDIVERTTYWQAKPRRDASVVSLPSGTLGELASAREWIARQRQATASRRGSKWANSRKQKIADAMANSEGVDA